MINEQNWNQLAEQFAQAQPYRHCVIDNFWQPDIANELLAEFPAYDGPEWMTYYNNPAEDKKTCNHWDKFKSLTYRAFSFLNSPTFVNNITYITGNSHVYTDVGLHGGGLHGHHRGGKLNIHLDYNIHPKLKLQRNYNLIVYMTPDWQPSWQGGLELWSHNEDGSPKDCVTTVENRFNRAVLFDTTQQSWHGLPENLTCPDDTFRRSMAVYYLTDPEENADPRNRAIFVPYKDQANDPEIVEMIKQRSSY